MDSGEQLREQIEEQARILAEPKLAELDVELVDAEYRLEPAGRVLRIYIDRSGGVGLDDCKAASRHLEPVFEAEGLDRLIPGAYNLEVSSPGLFRPLKPARDFQRAVGRRVKVNLRRPIEGQRVFIGILERFGDDHLFLRVGESTFQIELDSIAKANLEPELHF